jgi:hypothetical protein
MRVARTLLVSPALALTAAVFAAPADEAASRFRRDPAIMRAKQAQMVDMLRQRSPQLAGQLDAAFRQDIIAQTATALRPYNFSTDDVVDMTALYWITAWEGSNGLAGAKTDPAVAKGVRAQLAGTMLPSLKGMDDAAKQDMSDAMLLQALFAEARMTAAKQVGPAQLKAMSDAIYKESGALLKTDLRKVKMTAAGFRPVGSGAVAATPREIASAPAPAAANGRTPTVAGYYFRATYGLGAAITFEPLVFFASGEYVELDQTPLADLDAAADKAKSPMRWGRWRKQGATFLLTDSKGHVSDYRLGSGNFFPAFTAGQGPRLAGTYSNTTGGGNYMVGGAVTTLAVDRMTFNPDGSFTQGQSAGGIAPNAAIGNRRASAGRWRLDGTMLELAYADGRRVRTSFLWAASGTPPKPDIDMAFIGGDAFTRDD